MRDAGETFNLKIETISCRQRIAFWFVNECSVHHEHDALCFLLFYFQLRVGREQTRIVLRKKQKPQARKHFHPETVTIDVIRTAAIMFMCKFDSELLYPWYLSLKKEEKNLTLSLTTADP